MATKPVVISRKAEAAAMTAEERQMRVDLAACYRLIAHYDMDDLFATHISARVPGPDEHFLLNPYGVLYTADHRVEPGQGRSRRQHRQRHRIHHQSGRLRHPFRHPCRAARRQMRDPHPHGRGHGGREPGGGASAAHPEVDALLQPHRLSRLRGRRRRSRRARAAGARPRQAQCADPAQPRPAHLRPDGRVARS